MIPNSQQSAATEVWRRFSGMFGADAVERKFGREIPAEWQAMCSRLNDYQIQRGIRQLAYSGKAHVPSLPEFVKLCRDAEHDAKPASPHPALEGPERNPWELLANRRLLQYITKKVPENTKRYGDLPVEENPRFKANVNTLVAFKNRWLELMLASATDDGVPIKEQEDCWNECMRQAEAIIAEAA